MGGCHADVVSITRALAVTAIGAIHHDLVALVPLEGFQLQTLIIICTALKQS